MITSLYKKIAIIGCAGSGKTTLALQLSELISLPVIHLDRYYWLPNWQGRDFEEFKALHTDLCNQDSWIMEGCYMRVLLERIEHADLVIFLDFPRRISLWRVLKRLVCNYGKVRADVPENCPERFSWEFLTFGATTILDVNLINITQHVLE